jgi:hypothetical protein
MCTDALLRLLSNNDHFHVQGEDALSWDSNELTRIQNLHLRDFDSLEVRQKTACIFKKRRALASDTLFAGKEGV